MSHQCYRGSGIRFYRFPTDQDRRRQWIAFVSRINPDGSPWEPGDGDRVCSCHFISGIKSNVSTNPDCVPSVRPDTDNAKDSGTASLSRFERAQRRSRVCLEDQTKAHDEQQQHYLSAFYHDHGLLFRTGNCCVMENISGRGSESGLQASCMLTILDPSEYISTEVGMYFIYYHFIDYYCFIY